jgi:hypothetical protein
MQTSKPEGGANRPQGGVCTLFGLQRVTENGVCFRPKCLRQLHDARYSPTMRGGVGVDSDEANLWAGHSSVTPF